MNIWVKRIALVLLFTIILAPLPALCAAIALAINGVYAFDLWISMVILWTMAIILFGPVVGEKVVQSFETQQRREYGKT